MAKVITPVGDRTILHQADVEAVIDARAATKPAGDPPTIEDPAAPGASYAEAEAAAVRDALVALLDACRDAGIVAAAE